MPQTLSAARRPARAPQRVRLGSRRNTATTTVILPRSLHRRAQRAAVLLNWTLGELVRVALDEWLRRYRVA